MLQKYDRERIEIENSTFLNYCYYVRDTLIHLDLIVQIF